MDKATFSKEIAKVLRELEDTAASSSASTTAVVATGQTTNSDDDNDEIIRTTYQNFCYDDPIVLMNGTNIQLLQRALLLSSVVVNSPHRQYALSSRVIIGIHQCYQKYDNHRQTTTTPSDESSSTTTETNHSLLRSDGETPSKTDTNHSTTQEESLVSILARLLYTIHIQIPYQCCLSTTTLPQVIQYLGSYLCSNDDTIVAENVVGCDTTTAISTATTATAAVTTTIEPTLIENTSHIHPLEEDLVTVNGNRVTNGTLTPTSLSQNERNIINGNNNGNVNGGGHDNSHTTPDDETNDSLQEVFAEESDDFDYEFESDYIPNEINRNNINDEWMTTIQNAYDPIYLSKPTLPIESITWQHVSTTLNQLIGSISSSSSSSSLLFFTSILPIQWKKRNLSEPLQQLCIALLVPSSSQHSPALMTPTLLFNNATTKSESDNHSATNYHTWQQQLGVRLVNVFRDVTLYHINTMTAPLLLSSSSSSSSIHGSNTIPETGSNKNNDAIISLLEDYLRLIRILLLQGEPPKSCVSTISTTATKDTSASPAVLVGLSSLSSLCSDILRLQQQSDGMVKQKAINRRATNCYLDTALRTIQCNVIDLCYEFTDLLEQSLTKGIDDMVAIQWTYLSLFQILTVPILPGTSMTTSTTYRKIDTATSTASTNMMSTEYAQQLLNSGLFRQWLLVWSQLHHQQMNENVVENNNVKFCCSAVQGCILDLCVVSPTLLGKYAWRFPGLSEFVLKTNSDTIVSTIYDQSLVNVMIWNLLGMHCASATLQSTTPTIKWKQQSRNIAVPSQTSNYQQQAWLLFQSMCSNTLRIVTDWKIRLEHNIDRMTNGTTNPNNVQLQSIVNDWDRVTNRLATNPFLCRLFYQMVEQHNNIDQAAIRQSVDVSSSIREELNPIQRLLSSKEKAASDASENQNQTSDQLQLDEENRANKNGINDEDYDDDDEDHDDRIVQKKMEQRARMNMDQEMKWIGMLRKSMKDLLATIENVAAIVTTSRIESLNGGYVTLSNKTD